MRASGRVIQLDLLRAAAIVLVMGRHLTPYERGLPGWMQSFCVYWAQFGWTGVDLFFVLSGFLISGLLFREYQKHGGIHFWRFFTRRGFKIYPSLWLYVAAVVYVQYSNYNYGQASARRILSDLLFVANYSPGLLDHTWSLGVEEHFYILLPVILLVACWWGKGKPNPFKWLPWFWLVVSAGILGLRLAYGWNRPFSDHAQMFPTQFRMDSLLFGVLLSYFYHFHHDGMMGLVKRFRWIFLGIGLALLVPAVIYPVWTFGIYTWGFTGLYIAYGFILMVGLTMAVPLRGVLAWPLRAIGFVGAHSYTIYLWHMPVKIWGPMYATRWFGIPETPRTEATIYFVGSLILGIGLSMLLEWPVLALRDWLFPSRGAPPARAEDGQEGERRSGELAAAK